MRGLECSGLRVLLFLFCFCFTLSPFSVFFVVLLFSFCDCVFVFVCDFFSLGTRCVVCTHHRSSECFDLGDAVELGARWSPGLPDQAGRERGSARAPNGHHEVGQWPL